MSASRFDLIIFDYDGVVADSELLNNEVLAELLSDYGLPTTVDGALASYMGRRWRDIEPDIAAALGRPCPDNLLAEWSSRCETRATASLQPIIGFNTFLAARQELTCIASSSPPRWIELGLKSFGLRADAAGPIFSAAVHVTRGKPHPDLFLYASSAMRVPVRRAVVIEDTPTGVRAGVAAGMTVVGLCAGSHVRDGHADALRAAGADHVAHDYASIAALLDG